METGLDSKSTMCKLFSNQNIIWKTHKLNNVNGNKTLTTHTYT